MELAFGLDSGFPDALLVAVTPAVMAIDSAVTRRTELDNVRRHNECVEDWRAERVGVVRAAHRGLSRNERCILGLAAGLAAWSDGPWADDPLLARHVTWELYQAFSTALDASLDRLDAGRGELSAWAVAQCERAGISFDTAEFVR